MREQGDAGLKELPASSDGDLVATERKEETTPAAVRVIELRTRRPTAAAGRATSTQTIRPTSESKKTERARGADESSRTTAVGCPSSHPAGRALPELVGDTSGRSDSGLETYPRALLAWLERVGLPELRRNTVAAPRFPLSRRGLGKREQDNQRGASEHNHRPAPLRCPGHPSHVTGS